MPTFEFTVALDRAPADDDFDRLFDAGLDDTTPETRDGRGVLNVHREAASMSAAIVSVARDVTRAGFRVVAVEDDDLVSLKTVAQRTGRSYESVRLLAIGKRGPGAFPEPLSGDGWALYSWALVAEWYSRNYGADVLPAVSPDQRVLAAAALMLRAVETAGPATADLVGLVDSAVPPGSISTQLDDVLSAATRLTELTHPVFGAPFRTEPVEATASYQPIPEGGIEYKLHERFGPEAIAGLTAPTAALMASRSGAAAVAALAAQAAAMAARHSGDSWGQWTAHHRDSGGGGATVSDQSGWMRAKGSGAERTSTKGGGAERTSTKGGGAERTSTKGGDAEPTSTKGRV